MSTSIMATSIIPGYFNRGYFTHPCGYFNCVRGYFNCGYFNGPWLLQSWLLQSLQLSKHFNCPWLLLGIKNPVHRTGKKPDFQLQFDYSIKKKTKKKNRWNWTGLSRFNSVGMDLCSPCKYTLSTTILKKNGQELRVLQPKWYVTIKSNFHDNL